jgi:kynurenine formamidase
MRKEVSRRLALSSLASAALMVPMVAQAAPADEIANAVKNGEVVDLTVTVAENYPAHWPFHPPFKRWTMNWFEEVPGQYGKKLPARGAYYIATSAKIVDTSGGLSRALAIKPQGPGLGDS